MGYHDILAVFESQQCVLFTVDQLLSAISKLEDFQRKGAERGSSFRNWLQHKTDSFALIRFTFDISVIVESIEALNRNDKGAHSLSRRRYSIKSDQKREIRDHFKISKKYRWICINSHSGLRLHRNSNAEPYAAQKERS